MTTIRLGLIADTHWPSRIPELPYEVLENVFRSVDGILHAGDIEAQEVLDHLAEIAPTQAVKGEDDSITLPNKRILQFDDVRVGLVHGHRHPLIERYFRLQRRLGKRGVGGRELLDSLIKRFEDDPVDVIIFGHLHIPICVKYKGVLLVNPGSVYAMTLESLQWQLMRESDLLRRQTLREQIRCYRKNLYRRKARSTVGILEIGSQKKIVPHLIDVPLIAQYKAPTLKGMTPVRIQESVFGEH